MKERKGRVFATIRSRSALGGLELLELLIHEFHLLRDVCRPVNECAGSERVVRDVDHGLLWHRQSHRVPPVDTLNLYHVPIEEDEVAFGEVLVKADEEVRQEVTDDPSQRQ